MNMVDVDNLRFLLDQLEILISDYQNNYINLYNEIQDSEMFWQDAHSNVFFRKKTIEKSRIDITYDELESTKDIYKNIINMYGNIGDYIEFDLVNRQHLLAKFNTYINKLNRIYNLYCDLDYSFANPSIQSSIEVQKEIVRESLDDATVLREKIKTLMEEISENERKIKRMISKLNIKVLPQPSLEGVIVE